MKVDVRLSANGRICIPADVRQKLGLKDGDVLSLEAEDGGKITLKTRAQRVREVQEWFAELSKGKEPFTVDDFIRERRTMWGEDEA